MFPPGRALRRLRRHSDRRCASPGFHPMGRRRGRVHAARGLRAFHCRGPRAPRGRVLHRVPGLAPQLSDQLRCAGAEGFRVRLEGRQGPLFPYADRRGLVRPGPDRGRPGALPLPVARHVAVGAPHVPALDPQPANGTAHAGTPAGLGGHGVRALGDAGTARERGLPVPPLAAIRPEGPREPADGSRRHDAVRRFFDARSPALERVGG